MNNPELDQLRMNEIRLSSFLKLYGIATIYLKTSRIPVDVKSMSEVSIRDIGMVEIYQGPQRK